jgi:CRISPR-associated endonuclease/helicase Cas3
MYYAHISKDGRKQSVKEHLTNVAQLSEKFAIALVKPMAYAAGNGHDIGKYAEAFQDRLHGSNVKFEHSSCGAIAYCKAAQSVTDKIIAIMIAYCIAGHHTGLPDGGTDADTCEDVTLTGRLKRQKNYVGTMDYSGYKIEIDIAMPHAQELVEELSKCKNHTELIEKYAFFTRYLFSCLTDADYLDTELFCNPDTDRTLHADFKAASELLSEKFQAFRPNTELQKARSFLQEQAYENAIIKSNISILNMPTGSGKTLCSLKIALDKLKNDPTKKRILYVIPYTSIIEQTAEIFENIFGEKVDILQHHANYAFEDLNEGDTAQKLKKSSENWNAPLIITTSVQFFQSLYHYKSSSLRKLHNVADSIIIFDEIHLLPTAYIQTCLKGIRYITNYLNSEAIFLSATMPDYSKLFKRYLPDCSVNELITDKSCFQYFCKCDYRNLGNMDYESIIQHADSYRSSLIVVNKRKTAREIYHNITGKKYHLSTYMTPYDRSRTMEEIRKDLNAGEKITVVSTSLIEAGVDFDFEAVFRELAGLDNILQSGGRCNREGAREKGDVFIFETEDNAIHGIRTDITKSLLNEFEDISSPDCIREYYNRLFDFNQLAEQDEMSIAKDTTGIESIPFRTYAESFHFIKDDTIGVVINNCKETATLIEMLKNKQYSAKRKLQKYTVALKVHSEFEQALELGILDDFDTGVFVLTNPDYYDRNIGLCLDMAQDIIC